ncbi:replication initiator protein A [Enterococcus raffinosus]|uniref:replication initiator protein A n=1 Tax=Enterococcus raffinosus TaxID=71452 RepID=UPI0028921BA0|nr:replication initiator protein A [Enterococcus raffinosus]MDT2525104.1 replication initiator protein A [Enterococcus raffinosus]MDT2592459.1 replication initiator protein A [Enterococcus raffinosus]
MMEEHSGKRINILDEYRQKFYQIPMVFFTNPIYEKLKNDTKIAYAIMTNRMQLSKWTTENQNQVWIDDNGDIFFFFSNPQLAKILNVSDRQVTTIKKELKDANLLSVEPLGFNLPQKCYLHYPIVRPEDIKKINEIQKLENEELAEKGKASEIAKAIRAQRKNSKNKFYSSANIAEQSKDFEINDPNSSANIAEQSKDFEINDPNSSANIATPDSQNLLPNNTESTNNSLETIETIETEKASTFNNSVFDQISREEHNFLKEAFITRHESSYFTKQQLSKILLIASHDFSLAEEILKTANKAKKILESKVQLINVIDSESENFEHTDLVDTTINQMIYSIRLNDVDNLLGYVYTSFYNMFWTIMSATISSYRRAGIYSEDEFKIKYTLLIESSKPRTTK